MLRAVIEAASNIMTETSTPVAQPKVQALRAVKGMNDILPPDSAQWEWFEQAVRRVMHRYGYRNVRTPIVEPTALFVRGLGEVTDIVEKGDVLLCRQHEQ